MGGGTAGPLDYSERQESSDGVCSQMHWKVLWTACLMMMGAGISHAETLSLLREPGHVAILRHAHAPGVGDPPGMALDDCTTQRNLDARGRAQAIAFGEKLRRAGVTEARVFTSQWCRCRETAKLLAVGEVRELPALNSFFEAPEAKETRMRDLRAFLAGLPRDGGAVILVTHQVTITALTGYFPRSGEGLILKLEAGGGFTRKAEVAD